VPKYFDLCLDEVASVRGEASVSATAGILKNLVQSNKSDIIANFMEQLKYFKDSPSCQHRQTFVCMMQSILCDYFDVDAQVEEGRRIDLIELIVVKKFQKDLVELSKDKVVNVRIQLAEAFY